MVSTRGTFEGLCDPLYGWQSVANCCQKSVLPRRSGYLISVCIELNKVFWFFFFFVNWNTSAPRFCQRKHLSTRGRTRPVSQSDANTTSAVCVCLFPSPLLACACCDLRVTHQISVHPLRRQPLVRIDVFRCFVSRLHVLFWGFFFLSILILANGRSTSERRSGLLSALSECFSPNSISVSPL